MKKFLLLFLVFILTACFTTNTFVREYDKAKDYKPVVDSIVQSGTTVGPFAMWLFTIDNGRIDSVNVATLFKEELATGSIQIRKLSDGTYNIKIVDAIKIK